MLLTPRRGCSWTALTTPADITPPHRGDTCLFALLHGDEITFLEDDFLPEWLVNTEITLQSEKPSLYALNVILTFDLSFGEGQKK